MAEEKKRFPWRLLTGAVLLVILAAVVSFIETAGWKGTLVGKSERIKQGMSREDVQDVLGPGQRVSPVPLDPLTGIFPSSEDPVLLAKWWLAHADTDDAEWLAWKEDPALIRILFVQTKTDPNWKVGLKKLEMKNDGSLVWRIRRWAEQAYAAIHGPRR